MLHGWRTFETINFDAQTGKRINFNELINANKIASVDTVIIHKLIKELEGSNIELDEWLPQLSNLEYQIKEKGIEILFRGNNDAQSIIPVFITFGELDTLVNKNSFLKNFY